MSKAVAARRSQSDRDRYDERGDTLIEVLMTLIVLSIAVLALLISFATGISASVDHRNLAKNDVVLRQVEEQAFYQIQQQPSPQPLYTSCATVLGGAYSGITYSSLPSGYSVTMNPILYWDPTAPGGPAFDGTCAVDSPQLISLTLTAPNGSVATTTFVVDDLGAGPPGPLTLTSVSPSSAMQGTSNLALSLSGTGFASNATVTFSCLCTSGITVNSTTFVTPTLLDLNVSIAPSPAADVGTYTITVTNPTTGDTGSVTFTVIPSTLAGMHVSAMNSFVFFIPLWQAAVTVSVKDANGNSMRHVTVNGSWSSTTGGFTTSTCTTNGNGSCIVFYGFFDFQPRSGPVTYTVSVVTSGSTAGLVSPTGAVYTPSSNVPQPAALTVP